MSKTILFQKIHKELEKLNDRIDAKIIRGLAYEKEARRHKDLLATLQRISEESQTPVHNVQRRSRFGKSPVRQALRQGVFARLFERRLAF